MRKSKIHVTPESIRPWTGSCPVHWRLSVNDKPERRLRLFRRQRQRNSEITQRDGKLSSSKSTCQNFTGHRDFALPWWRLEEYVHFSIDLHFHSQTLSTVYTIYSYGALRKYLQAAPRCIPERPANERQRKENWECQCGGEGRAVLWGGGVRGGATREAQVGWRDSSFSFCRGCHFLQARLLSSQARCSTSPYQVHRKHSWMSAFELEVWIFRSCLKWCSIHSIWDQAFSLMLIYSFCEMSWIWLLNCEWYSTAEKKDIPWREMTQEVLESDVYKEFETVENPSLIYPDCKFCCNLSIFSPMTMCSNWHLLSSWNGI